MTGQPPSEIKPRRESFTAARPGHATSHINPRATSPEETNINLSHSTNPEAIDFSVHAQKVHREREIIHSADTLPAFVGSAHIAPLEKRHEPCRADKQDADKAKLAEGQGFVESGSPTDD